MRLASFRLPRRTLALTGLLLVALRLVYEPIWRGRVLATRDVYRLFIPDSAFLRDSLKAGVLPLWNPYEMLGQPFLAAMQTEVLYPVRIFFALAAGPVWGISLTQLFHTVLAVTGTYLACKKLGARWPSAVAGGIAFGLSALYTQLAAQQNIAGAAAYSGFIFAAAISAVRRPGARSAAVLAILIALSALAGSPEMLAWQMMLACVVISFAKQRARALVFVAAGLIVGVAVSSAVLIPAAELARLSERRIEEIDLLEWSVSLPDLVSVALPLANEPSSGLWGADQALINSLLVGSLPCVLALLSMRRRGPAAILGLAAVVLAAMSLGKYFSPAAHLAALPPFNLFRYPVKWLIGSVFCICLLSALGIERAVALARSVRPSLLRIGLAIVGAGATAALCAILPWARIVRAGTRFGSVWFAITVGLALVVFLGVPPGARRGRRVRYSLSSLATLEVILGNFLFPAAGYVPAASLSRPSALAAFIPKPFSGRISVDLPREDWKNVATEDEYVERSRDALIPNRNEEEHLGVVEPYRALHIGAVDAALEAKARATYDLLGATYFVRRGPPPFPDAEVTASLPGLPTLYHTRTAMPRAFVVHRARVVGDPEARAAIQDPSQPAREVAFLAEGEPLEAPCEGSRAVIIRSEPQEVAIDVDACGPGYLVVSDAAFPGWSATFDGKPRPILRADYVLRAVRVDPGRHAVIMRYRPKSFVLGGALSAVAATLVAATLVVTRPRRRQTRV
jgi:hypothetical protein